MCSMCVNERILFTYVIHRQIHIYNAFSYIMFLFLLLLSSGWRIAIIQSTWKYVCKMCDEKNQNHIWYYQEEALTFRRLTSTTVDVPHRNLQSCILYIYSTNIGTNIWNMVYILSYFSLQNAVCFIILTCLIPVLITFYKQVVLKFKKIIPAPRR